MAKFNAGQSGNPKGRPRGIADRRARLVQQLEKDLPKLLTKVKEMAMAGDIQALRLLLERTLPATKPRADLAHIPELERAGSLMDKASAVLGAIGRGEVSPDVGAQLVQAIGTTAKVQEVSELKERLDAIERALNKGK